MYRHVEPFDREGVALALDLVARLVSRIAQLGEFGRVQTVGVDVSERAASRAGLRAAAAFGLGSRPAVCVRSLALGMKDPSEQTRQAAAKSLAACAPQLVRSVLDQRPKEQTVQVRNALRDFLVAHGGMQSATITSQLRELLAALS